MPILANIHLAAAGNKLKISASDLEVTVAASIEADVKSSGSTTVSARVFSELIRELPEGEIAMLLTEGERLEVIAKGSKFKIIGVSAEEYPVLPGLSFATTGKINAKLFGEMIGKTLYAVSLDETRFNLSGVCFEMVGGGDGKSLRLVATDGHRLGLATRPVSDFDFQGRVIVPRKGLSEMRKILDLAGAGDVGLGIFEGFLVVETHDFKMSMRLIDGEYPDYSQVIPKEKGLEAIINSMQLTQALRRVMLMVADREKCVRMSFSKNHLRISSSSPEIGEASEELEVSYDGGDLILGFNAVYLLEVCASLGEEANIIAELNGELGPGKFRSENDEGSMAIVMPMRL